MEKIEKVLKLLNELRDTADSLVTLEKMDRASELLQDYIEEKNEQSFNISFDVETMIEEAKMQGFNCNEEQAKTIIEYLNNHCLGEVFKELDNIIYNYCEINEFKRL